MIRFCSVTGGTGINTLFIVPTASPGCAVAVAYWLRLSALRNIQAYETFVFENVVTHTACSVA